MVLCRMSAFQIQLVEADVRPTQAWFCQKSEGSQSSPKYGIKMLKNKVEIYKAQNVTHPNENFTGDPGSYWIC